MRSPSEISGLPWYDPKVLEQRERLDSARRLIVGWAQTVTSKKLSMMEIADQLVELGALCAAEQREYATLVYMLDRATPPPLLAHEPVTQPDGEPQHA